jgi:hypothetical protein
MPAPRSTSACALAAAASAALSVVLAPIAGATPVGPCAEVPYVGVCVPVSEQPSPPTQHTFGDVVVAPAPGGGADIQTVG